MNQPSTEHAFGTMKAAPAGVGSTGQGLTTSLDSSKEGLAVNATRICSIDGCGSAHHGRGYCRKHHERYAKHGDPHFRKIQPGASAAERLAQYSERVGDCIVWTASTYGIGYGQTTIGGKFVPAHRAAYELHVGPIPAGLIVRHKCDNPPCINPEHLELGTHADNARDRAERGRAAIGERSGTAKITAAQAMEIYARVNAGEIQRVVAEEFGIKQVTVSEIARGKSWAHVTQGAVGQ